MISHHILNQGICLFRDYVLLPSLAYFQGEDAALRLWPSPSETPLTKEFGSLQRGP
ncbi:hypothetical protein Esi_0156_0019 [Ectocarpus siliculosus]|uniref:Uncharacterized protein n=1 Tax=Ectocarpus siliculosus TaxID=2880 RepID=D7FL95_ECTSI|nr:hypothetical protein Esi_0156_0019 [Ectocarpus siliculosus]|eukprot:CBJ29666.1 hypothetical protein Esi_0156_0019 [Ectocarpus siliculosus]